MPIYEYHCKSCRKDFEKLVFAGDADKISCPACQSSRVIKKMSAATLMTPGSAPAGRSCSSNSPKPFS